MLSLTILGNNSAIPAFGRHPTAQLLESDESTFLIDCGEGTFSQLVRYKLKHSRISHIFISHLHGDHYLGLMGLLSTRSLFGRTQPIHVYAPEKLEKIIQLQLEAGESTLTYPLHFHALHQEGLIAETTKITVRAFRVDHRIACWGFQFQEKKNPRKVDPKRAGAFGIPADFYEQLQKGVDFRTAKGTIIPNSEVTLEAAPAKTYVYMADTRYLPTLLPQVHGADLLYHETTYLHADAEKAAMRYHSTTEQAAQLAKAAGVKRLMIGHFSSKYERLDAFLEETKAIFENTILAIEGTCYKIE
ncbi:MAG: ribonuclease Z [Ferruginibacter sp.]